MCAYSGDLCDLAGVHFNTIADHLSHDRLSDAVRCAMEDLGIQQLLRVPSHATT
jgi:hypothetical protein